VRGVHKSVDLVGRSRFLLENIINRFQDVPQWSYKNFTDHIYLIFALCERFWLHHAARPHRGHPFVYEQKALIVFFVAMQQCHTFRFKAQHRWLKQHPEMWPHFRLHEVSDRSTLSRHYKTLYAVLQDFIAFVGKEVVYLHPAANSSKVTGARLAE
jgi:hypothetical protein